MQTDDGLGSFSTKERWLSLWQRIEAKGDPKRVRDDLLARYSEPHRAYHTLEHIEHCLDEFEETRHFANSPNAVELAILYHDAIYDPKANDNEERSAALAVEMVKKAELPDSFGESVSDLIIATKHTIAPIDCDAKLLVDIDLSILGQPEDAFDHYERQIREEYQWVPEETFSTRRAAILNSFLDRKVIYSTKFFRDKYEEQARRNLSRSLAQLSTLS